MMTCWAKLGPGIIRLMILSLSFIFCESSSSWTQTSASPLWDLLFFSAFLRVVRMKCSERCKALGVVCIKDFSGAWLNHLCGSDLTSGGCFVEEMDGKNNHLMWNECGSLFDNAFILAKFNNRFLSLSLSLPSAILYLILQWLLCSSLWTALLLTELLILLLEVEWV